MAGVTRPDTLLAPVVSPVTPAPDLADAVPLHAACSLDEGLSDWHLLLWARSGEVQVEVGRRRLSVGSGQALWVPAGTPVRARSAPGAVCLPVAVPREEAVLSSAGCYVVDVPAAWHTWLLSQFSMRVTPLRAVDPLGQDLTELLAGRRGHGTVDVVLPMPRTQLRQPRSPALREVALELTRSVASTVTVAEWSHRAGMSERSLQRAFRDETALTFRDWRTALRLRRGAAHLAAGLAVTVAAHRVGFESAGGFSRAFRREFGIAPSGYAARVPAGRQGGVADLLRDRAAALPPAVGASATPPLVNDFHVLVWLVHGGAWVEVGDEALRVEQGHGIWLPAWRHNRVEVDPGGIMLPLQSAPPPTTLDLDAVVVFDLTGADTDTLLRIAVSQYTSMRPPGYDELAGWRAFERWASPARGPGGPDAAITATALRLLASGMPAGRVAAQLGYAHVSSFSRAFRRAHGLSPRDYSAQGGRP